MRDCSGGRVGVLRVRLAIGSGGRGTPNLRIWGSSEGTVGVERGRAQVAAWRVAL